MALGGHGDWVSTVALLPGNRALTGAGSEGETHLQADDTSIRLWDLASGKLVQRYDGLSHPASGFSVSPNGTRLMAVHEPLAQVWDLASGERTVRFDGVRSGVQPPWLLDAAFSPDGRRFLALGTFDVRVLDAGTCQPLVRLKVPERRVQFVTAAFSPDGMRIVTVQNDPPAAPSKFAHSASLWDARTGTLLRKLGKLNDWPQGALFAADQRVVTLDASALRVWNANTGRELASHEIPGGGAIAFALDPTRRYALVRVGYSGGFVWDVLKSRVTATVEDASNTSAGLVGFSADGRTFLVRLNSGYKEPQQVTVRDSATGKVVRQFRLEGSEDLR
jgi:WD40 repeat protein